MNSWNVISVLFQRFYRHLLFMCLRCWAKLCFVIEMLYIWLKLLSVVLEMFSKTNPAHALKCIERQWCSIFHYYWWTASIKPRLLFFAMQVMLPYDFPLFSDEFQKEKTVLVPTLRPYEFCCTEVWSVFDIFVLDRWLLNLLNVWK